MSKVRICFPPGKRKRSDISEPPRCSCNVIRSDLAGFIQWEDDFEVLSKIRYNLCAFNEELRMKAVLGSSISMSLTENGTGYNSEIELAA